MQALKSITGLHLPMAGSRKLHSTEALHLPYHLTIPLVSNSSLSRPPKLNTSTLSYHTKCEAMKPIAGLHLPLAASSKPTHNKGSSLALPPNDPIVSESSLTQRPKWKISTGSYHTKFASTELLLPVLTFHWQPLQSQSRQGLCACLTT